MLPGGIATTKPHQVLNIHKLAVVSSWCKEHLVSNRDASLHNVVFIIETHTVAWLVDTAHNIKHFPQGFAALLQEQYGVEVDGAKVIVSVHDNKLINKSGDFSNSLSLLFGHTDLEVLNAWQISELQLFRKAAVLAITLCLIFLEDQLLLFQSGLFIFQIFFFFVIIFIRS